MKIFGLTILRNAIKYDYSFRESLLSLGGLVQKIYLGLGDSEDETPGEIKKIPVPMEVIDSPWDPQMMGKGGIILSVQTNIVLNHLRQIHEREENSWGFYLQADEVIHEEDYDLIKKDLQYAEENDYDAVSFRYLHFWQTHHHIGVGKRWYPSEIRAIKLATPIESWGDAQSFRNVKKIFRSEAKIFHYGHVRNRDRYEIKKYDMHKLYHPTSDQVKLIVKKSKRKDARAQVLSYFGTHPEVMKERVFSMGDTWELEERDEIWIVGRAEDYSPSFIESVKAKRIYWLRSIQKLAWKERSRAVITDPSFMERILYRTWVPKKARSKLALPWNREFLLTLQLSERGIGLGKCRE
ncbi:MAG: hypothetical protein OXB88_06235 [Bacteriovoracales bacterium]|nr:hypothetical protein [Bacteriovoracales bacterium]